MSDRPDRVSPPDRIKAIEDTIARVDAAYTTPLSQDPYFVEVLKQATARIQSERTSKKQTIRMRNHLSHLTTAVSNLDEVIADTQANAQLLRALFSDVLLRSFLIGCGIDGTKVEKFNKDVESRRAGALQSNAEQLKKSEMGYKATVRTLAIAIKHEGQDFTTNALAEKVIAKWPGDSPRKSIRTVCKVIEEMEDQGLIQLAHDGRRKKRSSKR